MDGSANYVQACRGCHQASHEASTRDCADCHMQKRRTEDAVHVVMTDHVIRGVRSEGDLLAPLEERHDRLTGPASCCIPVERADSALYLAMADASAPALEKAIAAARPRHAEPFFALGEAYRISGRVEEATRAYRQATIRVLTPPCRLFC